MANQREAVEHIVVSLPTEAAHVGQASRSRWKGRVWQQQPRVSLPSRSAQMDGPDAPGGQNLAFVTAPV